ncbi:hypothetical protein A5768_26305 [Mycolicibacterium fortuitum]|uniref:hypothetical protein n=1 Tax=Mycolicibacterium fortuitum TaxID=1766 RepID=UPI0007EB7BFA|nr:hypothetical protein [Mycolicibacterium fortuitum]OBG21616.1 hypothetical protein A5768_26305 [Mycolicibacterium fortuitum]
MNNREIARQVHQIPAHVLTQALPDLRPVTDLSELRQTFAEWILGQRTVFPTWQAAWNSWTGATPERPGRVELHVRCPECRGTLITARRGIPQACTTCHGRRRTWRHSCALWQPGGAQ